MFLEYKIAIIIYMGITNTRIKLTPEEEQILKQKNIWIENYVDPEKKNWRYYKVLQRTPEHQATSLYFYEWEKMIRLLKCITSC